MRPRIEFDHGFVPIAGDFSRRTDYTQVLVTCDDGIFEATVVRDSRDQANRKLARMRALDKALRPALPRDKRKEIWQVWHSRATIPNTPYATSAAPPSESSISTMAPTPTPGTVIPANIWSAEDAG